MAFGTLIVQARTEIGFNPVQGATVTVRKTIQFVENVLHPPKFPKGYFVPGRMAMTCCADDMAFLGYACKYDKEIELEQKSWIKITAKVAIEYFEDYGKEGPVLHAVSVEKTVKPKNEVISFV